MWANDYLADLLDAQFDNLLENASDDWESASLLDIASYKNGLAMQRFRPVGDDPGLPVLKIRELGQGYCGSDAERCCSNIDESVTIHDGDLVFSWSGTLLLDFWAGGDAGLNQHLFKVTSEAYPSWFYYMWTKQHMRRFIALAKDRATTMGHIKRSALQESEVLIPPANMMTELTERMQPIVDEMIGLKVQSRELGELRDVLLPKLMAGEIDVSQIELPTQPNNHLSHSTSIPSRMFSLSPLKGSAMETAINLILAQMQPILNCGQLKRLDEVLRFALSPRQDSSADLLRLFLTAKEVEGCSVRTITYYESTIQHMVESIGKPYTQIESDDLRGYLADYEAKRKAGKVTIDNIRRILSSFFSWLEDEDYIVKSPVRRIHRVKTATVTKEVLSDEDLETLRDSCPNTRDLAIVDMLATTGMRIGELVGLDIADIDLQERECIVTGKGNKQRPVYFDARAKLHLQAYLDTRTDNSPALFVSLDASATRLSIGCVESRLRDLGKVSGVGRVHPHKFRRTLATHAIDKGMPIEQVQKLLGHARIDTTMHYAMVNQNNVKASHRKYLE